MTNAIEKLCKNTFKISNLKILCLRYNLSLDLDKISMIDKPLNAVTLMDLINHDFSGGLVIPECVYYVLFRISRTFQIFSIS